MIVAYATSKVSLIFLSNQKKKNVIVILSIWWFYSTAINFQNDIIFYNFQNVRPSVEGLPGDIVSLLQSCWAEDPKVRPEFKEITATLTNLLHNFFPTETKPSEIEEIDCTKSHAKEDSIAADPVINEINDDKGKKQKTSRTFLGCFPCCVLIKRDGGSCFWLLKGRAAYNSALGLSVQPVPDFCYISALFELDNFTKLSLGHAYFYRHKKNLKNTKIKWKWRKL